MTMANEVALGEQPHPLVVSRTFRAPRDLVFRAWSSADHVKRWFCPAGYSVPQAEVEFRVGGAFNICMRSPEGQDHWTRGKFAEIVPNDRLVIDMHVVGERDAPLFRAYTIVTFADDRGVTKMEVTQRYTLFEPLAARMIQGAWQGWGQTLNRLEQELVRIKGSELDNVNR